MPSWQTLSSKEMFKNPWISVRQDEVVTSRGKPLTYGVVDLRHPSVFIIAVNAEGGILMQRNYRYAVDKDMWEFPAGHSDGQDLLVAAQRELLEETGLSSEDWSELGSSYQATGIGNIPTGIFLARNVQQTSDERDEEEEITEQCFMSIDRIEAMIKSGEFVNAPAIAALYLAKLQGL